MVLFERLQLVEEAIVRRVRDLRIVENVVAVEVMVDLFAQLVESLLHALFRTRRHGPIVASSEPRPGTGPRGARSSRPRCVRGLRAAAPAPRASARASSRRGCAPCAAGTS